METLNDRQLGSQGHFAPNCLHLTESRKDTGKRSLAVCAAVLTAGIAGVVHAASPTAVSLGSASHYAILAQSGITDVPTSTVTGRVGVSPITGGADLLSCSEVKGLVLSVDSAGPAPCSRELPGTLAKDVLAMQAAYTDAAGRTPDVVELGAGNIGGLVLAPGVYRWSTPVVIPTTVTLNGNSTDVWILQAAQTLSLCGEPVCQAAGRRVAQERVLAGRRRHDNLSKR